MKALSPLYIGLDLGTSGCRGSAIDDAGREQATARSELPPSIRRGSSVEQHPESWWTAVTTTLRELLSQLPPEAVQAIAVDGTSGSVLLTNAQGRPLGPALMYDDTRATAQAERIAAVAPRTSAAHGAGGGLAKLLWLLEHHGTGAVHALHQADWVVGRLTGRFGLSDPNNCLKSGYDPMTGVWPDWLAPLGMPRALLPQVLPPGTPLAALAAPLARELGLRPETRVVAGTTDSTAAILATGANHVGEAVTSLGSTLVTKVICQQPIFAPEYGIYSQPLGEHWLAGGGSNTGGAVLRHFFSDARMAAMTPQLDPDRPTGLDYYPLLSPGERFPESDPYLAPRLDPRPEDPLRFFQGLLEGMARIEAAAYRLLAELGAPYPESVRSVGGGAQNPAWSRIRARLLNTPLLEAVHCEAAYGAALLARRGAPSKK